MKLRIDDKNVALTEGMKSFIESKSQSLNKYLHAECAVHWMVTHEKNEYLIHLHILSDHVDYFSEAHEAHIRSAIASAAKKIETQLRKRKEIFKAKKHNQKSYEKIKKGAA
jgi:ribosomal subunit interface protein